jgi:hypothetical protein
LVVLNGTNIDMWDSEVSALMVQGHNTYYKCRGPTFKISLCTRSIERMRLLRKKWYGTAAR